MKYLILFLLLLMPIMAVGQGSAPEPAGFRKPGTIILNKSADSVGFIFGNDTSWFAATGIQYRMTNATDGTSLDLDTGMFILIDSGGSADSAYALGYGFGGSAFNDTEDAGFHHTFPQTAGNYYGIYITTSDSLTPFGQPILLGSNTKKYGGTLMKINSAGYGNGLHISKAASDTAKGALILLEDWATSGSGLALLNVKKYSGSKGQVASFNNKTSPGESVNGVLFRADSTTSEAILLQKGIFTISGTIGDSSAGVILDWAGGTDGQVLTYQADGTTKYETLSGSTDSIVGIAVQDTAGNIADNYILKFDAATDSLFWETDVGSSSLTYFTESDDNDTSVFTATAPNTRVGFNDTLTMQGNAIIGAGDIQANGNVYINYDNSSLGGYLFFHDGTYPDSAFLLYNRLVNTFYFSGDVSTNGNDLTLVNGQVYGADVVTTDTTVSTVIIISGDTITDFAGTNLSVTGGVLNASAGSGLWDTLSNDSTIVYVASDTMIKINADDDTTFISSADNSVLVMGTSGGLTKISDSLLLPDGKTWVGVVSMADSAVMSKAYIDGVSSIDSFYVAEAAATTTGWKQAGDTIFIDTSSGGAGGGTTDSVYWKRTDSSGSSRWITPEDTIWYDTSASAGIWVDTVGMTDTALFVDSDGDTVVNVYDNDANYTVIMTGSNDTLGMYGGAYTVIGSAGLTEMDSLRLLGSFYLRVGADTVAYDSGMRAAGNGYVLTIDTTGDTLYWSAAGTGTVTNTILTDSLNRYWDSTTTKTKINDSLVYYWDSTTTKTKINDSLVYYWDSTTTKTKINDSLVYYWDSTTTKSKISDSLNSYLDTASVHDSLDVLRNEMGDSARAAAADTAGALRGEIRDTVMAVVDTVMFSATIMDPSNLNNDTIVFREFDASKYSDSLIITELSLSTREATSDSAWLEIWTSLNHGTGTETPVDTLAKTTTRSVSTTTFNARGPAQGEYLVLIVKNASASATSWIVRVTGWEK